MWPGLKLPRFTLFARFAAYCAQTLRDGLISVPAWDEVVTAFFFTRTSWPDPIVLMATLTLVAFFCGKEIGLSFSLSLFCSSQTSPLSSQNQQDSS